MYSIAALISNHVAHLYFKWKFRGPQFEANLGGKHATSEFRYLATLGDRRLYFFFIITAIHTLADPYFVFTLPNLCEKPCLNGAIEGELDITGEIVPEWGM